jgi:AhpD family alkylhydroperoxidase
MQPRITNPLALVSGAFEAQLALSRSTANRNVPETTILLVDLRAGQINGCSVCVALHAGELKLAGERDERINAVAAWRETPWFTDAERAALALTEALTRLSDRPDAVADEIWNEAARDYDEAGLAVPVVAIASINVRNRLNAATHQIAGQRRNAAA